MFEEGIGKIFESVSCYKESGDKVSFETDKVIFTAEKLFALSNLLGTGVIEIEAETRSGGYCDTCSYEYGVMVLTAGGVKF